MGILTADPSGTASAPRGRFLHHLNPLAKIAATLPAMAGLLFTRDQREPLAFVLLALLLILLGARLRAAIVVGLLVVLPALVLLFGFSFGLWTDASRLSDQRILFAVGAFH